jgi:hypothetical protein
MKYNYNIGDKMCSMSTHNYYNMTNNISIIFSFNTNNKIIITMIIIKSNIPEKLKSCQLEQYDLSIIIIIIIIINYYYYYY